jgi:hypothetical protein
VPQSGVSRQNYFGGSRVAQPSTLRVAESLTHWRISTYAISHASAALALKKRYPRVGLWPLLIAVQLVELLWIIFSYLGIERVRTTADKVHLDFLPYSHSVFTSVFLAGLAWGFGKAVRRTYVGTAIGLAILSHIVLDFIQHEPDIALLPLAWGPRFGLNLQAYPALDLIVELVFCVGCWAYFGGSRGLLAGIVVLNLLDIPLMFPRSGIGARVTEHPALLPTVILIQVVVSWLVVWWLGHRTIIPDDPRQSAAAVV